jgi:hypothetical protein
MASQGKAELVALPDSNLWEHRYALSQHWASDMKFFEDELNFFRLLIDKHLSLLIEEKNVDRTRTMVSHIKEAESSRLALAKKIDKHIKHIYALVENPFGQNSQAIREEHGRLESDVLEFVKKFRTVKTEVFKVTESVIHSGRLNRLIGAT